MIVIETKGAARLFKNMFTWSSATFAIRHWQAYKYKFGKYEHDVWPTRSGFTAANHPEKQAPSLEQCFLAVISPALRILCVAIVSVLELK